MIRSIVFPRVLGRSREHLQPALELFRALGFASGNEWHEGGNHGMEMLAPGGGVEFIAAPDAPSVDAMVEVSDADAAYTIVRKLVSGDPIIPNDRMSGGPGLRKKRVSRAGGIQNGAPVRVTKPISDTAYGARLFEVEVSGLRIGFLTYARKAGGRGMQGSLDAGGKKFAVVVSRFNSFITERLLDGALQALRQCGVASGGVTIVHVPGAFEIPVAARQLAETKEYAAVVCIGCLLRGGTLHYEVIANEVTRGVGQSAQETGVPHAFGVLTCDTLEQAIDRAGLKAGNKGFEAGLAAVEMASLRQSIALPPDDRLAQTAASSTRAEAFGRDDNKKSGATTRSRSAAARKGAR